MTAEQTDRPMNILIAGVGGQGVVSLSDLVVQAAFRAGLDVKQSEIHGMAQRGGSVCSHVRFDRRIHSPVIDEGTANILVALERLEALRHLHYLAPGGLLIADTLAIPPMPVSSGQMDYPPDVVEQCRARIRKCEWYHGLQLTQKVGDPRMLNTCFAGILSRRLPFPEEDWRAAIEERFADRGPEPNLRAFELGRSATPLPGF